MAGTALVVATPSERTSLLTDWLQRMAFEVTVAPNPTAGLEAFQKDVFRLLVAELEPPGLETLSMLARLRELRPGQGTPTVVVTGARGPELDRLRSFASHLDVDAFLHDPIEPQRLRKRLVQALGREVQEIVVEVAKDAADEIDEHLLTLRFERDKLKGQGLHARLGCAETATRDELRTAYFSLVASFHAERAQCRTEASRALVNEIQELLRESWLGLRRTPGAKPAPRKPGRERRAEPPTEPQAAPTAEPEAQPGAEPAPEPSVYRDPPKPSVQERHKRRIAAGDEDPADLARLARIASILGDHTMAQRLAQRALELEPKNAMAREVIEHRVRARKKGALRAILDEKE